MASDKPRGKSHSDASSVFGSDGLPQSNDSVYQPAAERPLTAIGLEVFLWKLVRAELERVLGDVDESYRFQDRMHVRLGRRISLRGNQLQDRMFQWVTPQDYELPSFRTLGQVKSVELVTKDEKEALQNAAATSNLQVKIVAPGWEEGLKDTVDEAGSDGSDNETRNDRIAATVEKLMVRQIGRYFPERLEQLRKDVQSKKVRLTLDPQEPPSIEAPFVWMNHSTGVNHVKLRRRYTIDEFDKLDKAMKSGLIRPWLAADGVVPLFAVESLSGNTAEVEEVDEDTSAPRQKDRVDSSPSRSVSKVSTSAETVEKKLVPVAFRFQRGALYDYHSPVKKLRDVQFQQVILKHLREKLGDAIDPDAKRFSFSENAYLREDLRATHRVSWELAPRSSLPSITTQATDAINSGALHAAGLTSLSTAEIALARARNEIRRSKGWMLTTKPSSTSVVQGPSNNAAAGQNRQPEAAQTTGKRTRSDGTFEAPIALDDEDDDGQQDSKRQRLEGSPGMVDTNASVSEPVAEERMSQLTSIATEEVGSRVRYRSEEGFTPPPEK
ncbi:hypothetical protein BJ508DRAFT_336011 [Ascobolus immersus RN42]|uniref:Uncharacterized protein n=1 Tax=Ascobolus immersus RN42 TaxID=1160509 RepID=A0A3N4HP73_ASCIM|nr:hypothetical protein BJ508DRAFT_336011 [Ascobolus immersus RN42]